MAVLGNFVNRALVLTQKYYGGEVPACGTLTDYDRGTLAELQAVKATLEQNIENYRFREALKEAMNVARIGNKYLADCEPWKLVKTDPERVKTILNIALQITANLSIVVEPFMPFTAAKLLAMLRLEPLDWERIGATDLVPPVTGSGRPSCFSRRSRTTLSRRSSISWRRPKRQIWRQSRLKILILRKIAYRSTISNAWIYVFRPFLRPRRSPRPRSC